MKYAIYAKLPEEKRFYPIGGYSIVKNLIYAETWEKKELAEKACHYLIIDNPDIKFKVRAI